MKATIIEHPGTIRPFWGTVRFSDGKQYKFREWQKYFRLHNGKRTWNASGARERALNVALGKVSEAKLVLPYKQRGVTYDGMLPGTVEIDGTCFHFWPALFLPGKIMLSTGPVDDVRSVVRSANDRQMAALAEIGITYESLT